MLEGRMLHIWFALNVPRSTKFTAFVDESVEKNRSASINHGGFKTLLDIASKKFFEQIYMYMSVKLSF